MKINRLLLRLTAVLFFPILFLLPSCKKKSADNYFYTYIQSDPGKIDPFYSTDVVSGRILAVMCSGLFRVDSMGGLVNDLAESYTFDGRVLTVRLKSGLSFHDGNLVTPDDVIFSFDRIRKSEKPTSPRKWIFSNIKSISSADISSVRIELARESSSFIYLLTTPNCYIISKNSFLKDGSITGSGPFRLKEWERDDRIVFIKNRGYMDGEPGIEGIVFKVIPEDLTARFEFLNSTIDYFELPYLSRVDLKKTGVTYMNVPELSVHYIALNTRREPFDNRLFRKALNMAIDRASVMKSLFGSRFALAAGPVPRGAGDYRSTASPVPYDPLKAGEIFSRLNLKNREFTLLIKSDHQVSLISQMIQYYLAKAGVRIKISQLGWSALKTATQRGDFDMAYLTWHADYPEAENFLYPLFYSKNSGAGGNRSFFSNSGVDRLLLRAGITLQPGKRFAIYNEIERIIIDEAPWIFLWYGDKRIALSERIRKFVPYPIYNGMKGNEILLKKGDQ